MSLEMNIIKKAKLQKSTETMSINRDFIMYNVLEFVESDELLETFSLVSKKWYNFAKRLPLFRQAQLRYRTEQVTVNWTKSRCTFRLLVPKVEEEIEVKPETTTDANTVVNPPNAAPVAPNPVEPKPYVQSKAKSKLGVKKGVGVACDEKYEKKVVGELTPIDLVAEDTQGAEIISKIKKELEKSSNFAPGCKEKRASEKIVEEYDNQLVEVKFRIIDIALKTIQPNLDVAVEEKNEKLFKLLNFLRCNDQIVA